MRDETVSAIEVWLWRLVFVLIVPSTVLLVWLSVILIRYRFGF